MKKLEYQVSFTTPAFLGNAEQQAQWRTPPFKALIRQWWRGRHPGIRPPRQEPLPPYACNRSNRLNRRTT